MHHKMSAIVIIVVSASLSFGLRRAIGQVTIDKTIVEYKLKPKLGQDYELTSVFKLATRKQNYRIGEMMRVDLALLNSSSESVFFRRPRGLSVTLEARDENGSVIKVLPYSIESEGIYPDLFIKLGRDEMLVDKQELLIGCNDEGFAAYREAFIKLDEDVHKGKVAIADKGLFDRNLFTYWGGACLQLSQPGKYSITATVNNEYVIVSPSERGVKTAVGTIRSTPLTFEITK